MKQKLLWNIINRNLKLDIGEITFLDQRVQMVLTSLFVNMLKNANNFSEECSTQYAAMKKAAVLDFGDALKKVNKPIPTFDFLKTYLSLGGWCKFKIEKAKMIHNAKKSFYSLTVASVYYESWAMPKKIDEIYKAWQRGVEFKVIYPKSISLEKIIKVGVEKGWLYKWDWVAIHRLPKVQVGLLNDKKIHNSFLIIDEKETFLTLPAFAGNIHGGILIRDGSISRALIEYYKTLEKDATQ